MFPFTYLDPSASKHLEFFYCKIIQQALPITSRKVRYPRPVRCRHIVSKCQDTLRIWFLRKE